MPKRKASEMASDLFGETVTVVVGTAPSTKSFTLYKGILSQCSGYFDAAINGDFAEAKSGIIELPDERVEVFANFVLWLYGRPIQSGSRPFMQYCELWVFGDRRQIPQLMNTMIDQLNATYIQQWKFPCLSIVYIYENTDANAELRRFLIVLVCGTNNSQVFMEKYRDTWPKEALYDILKIVWPEWQNKGMTRDERGKMDLSSYYRNEPAISTRKQASSEPAEPQTGGDKIS